MKVLLIREVPGLGVPGDVVEVKKGHAHNYLLPRRLAVPPTPHELERYGKLRAQYAAELADRRTQARLLAERMSGVELVFPRLVHDEDKLYAAVRPQDVAKEIEERFGVPLDPKRIRMDPIETIGEYEVEIGVYEDSVSQVKVKVVATD